MKKGMVDLNSLIGGIKSLNQAGNKKAGFAWGVLCNLHYKLFVSEYALMDFEGFCDSTGIDEDELNNAMEEAKKWAMNSKI